MYVQTALFAPPCTNTFIRPCINTGLVHCRLLQYPAAYNDSLTVVAAFGFVNKLLYQDACQPDPKNCVCPYSQAIPAQPRIFIFLAAIPHLRCAESLSDQSGDGQEPDDKLYLIDMKGFRMIYSDKNAFQAGIPHLRFFRNFFRPPTSRNTSLDNVKFRLRSV